MFKKNSLWACLLFCISFNAWSQAPQLGNQYSLIRNNPEDPFKNLTIGLIPLYTDFNYYNNNIGGGLQLSYLYKNSFQLSAEYRIAYLDRFYENFDKTKPNGYGVNGSTPAMNGELNMAYYVSHKTLTVMEPARYFKGKGATMNRYYVDLQAKRSISMGFRVGGIFQSTWVQDNNGRITFGAQEVANPENRISRSGAGFSTTMTSFIAAVGFSRLLVRDFQAQIEGENSEIDMFRVREFYVDFLFAPSIALDNMYYTRDTQGTYVLGNVQKYTAINQFGIRGGYSLKSTGPKGFVFGLEGGIRPGVKLNEQLNTYLVAKIGFALSTKL